MAFQLNNVQSNSLEISFAHGLENDMKITNKARGIIFLCLGLFFSCVFLVGGGVVTANNGGYWTLVFIAAYLLGLVCVGLPLYLSVRVSTSNLPVSGATSQNSIRKWLPGIGFVLSFALSLAFFRSDAIATAPGMHLFMIGMGVCLSLFVPLGLGMMHRIGEASESETGR